MIDKISYGTYRTTLNNAEHFDSLVYALENNFSNIDTSSNYMFGDAERMIAKAIKNISREKLNIVSKGGYIQGPNLKRLEDGWSINDVVKYSPGCYHCISKDFLSDQIDKSLERLESEYIDTYLLHNPEYYLMKEIKSNSEKEDIIKHQIIMKDRIFHAFCLLEEKVKEGKIKSYGISSNSFSKKHNDIHFLDYSDLIDIAKRAKGDNNHNLTTLQMPMNLLELDGEPCARWAKENNLETQVNRPLNAFDIKEGMIRLAEYSADKDEYQELKTVVLNYKNKELIKIIEEIEGIRGKIRWVGDVDDIIDYQVLPYVHQVLKLEGQELKDFIVFLKYYKNLIKSFFNEKLRDRLYSFNIDTNESIESFALKTLLKDSNVDRVLIGMRKKEYVDSILNLLKTI